MSPVVSCYNTDEEQNQNTLLKKGAVILKKMYTKVNMLHSLELFAWNYLHCFSNLSSEFN